MWKVESAASESIVEEAAARFLARVGLELRDASAASLSFETNGARTDRGGNGVRFRVPIDPDGDGVPLDGGRMLFGSDHRLLLPVSALGGAIFLMIADAVARTVISPNELPVGVITAFLGAPFFIYLLKTRGSRWSRS